MTRRALPLLLILLHTPAWAIPPWLGGESVDDDGDAVAEAPTDVAPPGTGVDLSSVRGALEDGMRRVLRDGVDPVEALPLAVRMAPETTRQHLKDLLTGSGTVEVSLAAMQLELLLWSGDTVQYRAALSVYADKTTRLLRMVPASTPEAPTTPAVELPGGLGVSWRQAESQVERLLRGTPCTSLPTADDALLGKLVPPTFLVPAQTGRNQAVDARTALCTWAGGHTWQRVELRLEELHFNLFDKHDELRGGVQFTRDAESPALTYPMFKLLPR